MRPTHPPGLHFVVAGSLDQRTGGYRYDARMVRGLRGSGWEVVVHELPGRWPDPSAETRRELDDRLAAIPDATRVVIDGLVGGSTPRVLERHADRRALIALVHHPLADETGCSETVARERVESESRALASATGVIVTSTFTADRLRDFDVDPDRIRIVEPGTARVEATTRSDSTSTGPEGDDGERSGDTPPVLLCVGSVVPRKDQVTLVRALARMADAPWRCAMVGSLERDPDYAEKVRGEIADAGLTDRIRLTGEVDEPGLEQAWSRADVFVLPSRYEGYGMACTEAMMRGLPVLSTTGGAVPHTVPADVGRLVEPGDVDGLEEILRRVVVDADLRRGMAAASLRHAAGLPDWPAQVRRFAEAIRELGDG